MVIGILRVELHVYEAHSLKEKRAVLQSLIRRLRNLGTLSVAEVDHQDSWQRSALGIVTVAADAAGARKGLQQAVEVIDMESQLELLQTDETIEVYDRED